MKISLKEEEAKSQKQFFKASFKISLAIKVTALTVISIAAVAAVSNLIIFNLSIKALEEEIRNNLILLASSASTVVDADKFKQIRTAKDEGNQIYLEIQKVLQNIKEASRIEAGMSDKLRYVYTISKSQDKYIYVVDAVPIEDRKEHSSVGDEFPIEQYPEAINGFKFPTADFKAMRDEEFGGMVQSGYAPIKDKEGNVVGMIAIDMDVSVLREKEQSLFNARLIAIATAFILALLLGAIFSNYITKPITLLTKGTKRIAEGYLDTFVTINRNDELGELAQSFNTMACDLKDSHAILKKYNSELEEKVALRTDELSNTNKEIKDILDNISQAMFTIDSELRFNSHYSRYAYNIFGYITFAQKNLLDVFFPGDEQKEKRELMKKWLTAVFDAGDFEWEKLEPLQPIREATINVKKDNTCITKFISIKFEPIYNSCKHGLESGITKVMVIAQDITETKVLQMEMQKKEQEYKDNIDQIVEIIKIDHEIFEDFIAECKDSLSCFEPMMIKLKECREDFDTINNLFRIMHTIKGNAKAFKLERIAGQAHSMEGIFAAIKNGEKEVTEELLNDMFKRLDYFNQLFNETMDIYNRILHGKSLDIGKTRDKNRLKVDSDVIKVKVQEIERLSKLINEAESIIRNNGDKEAISAAIKESASQVEAMRKIEIGRLFTRFPRLVHDVSNEIGKKVKLIIKGDDVEIDKYVFDHIADPLIHIIRNSLDHGIEWPGERTALGKPEEGIIEINVELTDCELLVEISDDGRGLNTDKIIAKAIQRGVISSDKIKEMSELEVVSLIFNPGFSTCDNVTNISGRGMGMFVVKSSVEESLKGTVQLMTSKHQGLRTVLKIPV